MQNENELKQSLIHFVQEFGRKWNEIERDIYKKSNNEKSTKVQTDWFITLKELRYPLYEHYCTDKKRAYGGKKNCNSFGFPAKYNGIENPIKTSVELKTKSRAEVYIKTNIDIFKDEYLFIILKKQKNWKIDSYKHRRYENIKWDLAIL